MAHEQLAATQPHKNCARRFAAWAEVVREWQFTRTWAGRNAEHMAVRSGRNQSREALATWRGEVGKMKKLRHMANAFREGKHGEAIKEVFRSWAQVASGSNRRRCVCGTRRHAGNHRERFLKLVIGSGVD